MESKFLTCDFEHLHRTQIFTFSGKGTEGTVEKSARMSVVSPKYLTPNSTVNTNFIKLYANNRIRDVHSLHHKEEDKNSFRRVVSFLMLIAQCFALCPVKGITGLTAQHLRFSWCSWRVGYCVVIMIGMMAGFGFTTAFYMKGFFSFETSSIVLLYPLGFACCACFMNLARSWPRLEELWQRVEHEQVKYGYPKKLHLNIKIILAVTLSIALGEHLLKRYTLLSAAALCSESKVELLKLYYLMHYRYVFEFIKFSLPVAFLCEFVNFFAAFYWNFVDLFVMVVSMAMASRFRLLNRHLKLERGKFKPEEFWRETRENYNSLSVLTRYLDSCISSIVLLSFATNMFYICQQLYNILRKSIATLKLIYFFVSFSYLLFRTIAVSLCAASIHDESRATRNFLYAVPTQSYKIEVHRFIVQISTDSVALTGFNFFTVNRTLLLTLGGTVVTYVVVMVQFSNPSASQSSNDTQLCLNISKLLH